MSEKLKEKDKAVTAARQANNFWRSAVNASKKQGKMGVLKGRSCRSSGEEND